MRQAGGPVRADLIETARQVLSAWRESLEPIEGLEALQLEAAKRVFRVRTRRGRFALKRMPHGLDRSLWSLGLSDHTSRNGGPVPAVLPTDRGELVAHHADGVYAVQTWVDGVRPDEDRSAHREQMLRALAAFHGASRGYVPPVGAAVSSKLGRWPELWDEMGAHLARWASAASGPARPAAAHLSAAARRSQRAVAWLERAGYQAVVASFAARPGACHQDFGPGNAVLTEHRVWVIDLDGATFDLPARDLRKWINRRAEAIGDWRPGLARAVLQAYERGVLEPMPAPQVAMLGIDLLAPHLVFAVAKNVFKKGEAPTAAWRADVTRADRIESARLDELETWIRQLLGR